MQNVNKVVFLEGLDKQIGSSSCYVQIISCHASAPVMRKGVMLVHVEKLLVVIIVMLSYSYWYYHSHNNFNVIIHVVGVSS